MSISRAKVLKVHCAEVQLCIMRAISFALHLVTGVHIFQFVLVTNCTPKKCRLVSSDRCSETDTFDRT